MRDDLTRIGRRFLADVQRDDVAGLAAELAYRFLFAIFPFGIFVAALTAFVAAAIGVGDPTSQILGAIGDNLPRDVAGAIRPQLEAVVGTTRPGLLTLGAVAALWAATGGLNALIKAMNRAYEVEETRPLVPRYGLAIGLTLLASIGLIVAFVTIVGASLLTGEVVQRLRLDPTVVDVVGLLRWPVVFVFLSAAVAVLYKLGPNVRVPFRWCLAGGALFSVGWLVATAVFALYVANFANYSNTYGALGGVIVLMLWFYLTAFILVASAAFVAAALKEVRPATVEEGRRAAAVTPKAADGPLASAGDAPAPAPPAHAATAPVLSAASSSPGDWAIAGSAVAVGVAVGTLMARLVGGPTRR